MKQYDVVIIGAGVTGAAIARSLSRYRLKIAIVDREADVSFGTSKANSGIIHAGFHSTPGLIKTGLCLKGNRAFDALAEELGVSFERRGELVVAFDDLELEMLRRLYSQGVKNRVPFLEIVGPDRVREMEPNLNPDIIGALYAPTAGIIEPYEYCFALVENAVANGVDLFLEERVRVIAKGLFGLFQIESDSGLKLSSRIVINAAGLHADLIASCVGLSDFKIFPRKGEEYLLDKRVGDLVRRVIFPVPGAQSKGMLIIPTVDRTVMVGPTAEDTQDREDFSTTNEGLSRVFENAKKMVPGIRTSDIITSFAGIRPVASGDDFIIGASRVQGFINAAGIQSPGLTASPAIADMVTDIIANTDLRMEIKKDFNPVRKPFVKLRHHVTSRDYDSFISLAKDNPGYRSLVCRCENVTEAEIVEAVRRGHVTLDGIKFATRAGMGRCQGGFCTYRLLKIICRETGIPMEKITKKGPGSEIVKLPLSKGGLP